MKAYRLLIAIILTLSSQMTMAEAHSAPSRFVAEKLSSGKIVAKYCEQTPFNENCETLGNPRGYTTKQWQSISEVCSYRAWLNPKLTIALYAVTTLVGSRAGYAGMAVGAGVAYLLTPEGNPELMSTAARKMPGLLDTEADFAISQLDSLALREGTKMCTHLYDTTPAYWLEDCNDLECKKEVAQGLCLSDKEIQEQDAYDLFFIKAEIEKSYQLSGKPMPTACPSR